LKKVLRCLGLSIIAVSFAVHTTCQIAGTDTISTNKASATATASVADVDGYHLISENNSFAFYFKNTSGELFVTDKSTGKQWRSTPINFNEDTTLAGSVTMRYESQLLVKYADVSGNVYELSSKAACINQNGLKVVPITNGIKAIYSFPKQGFVIPVTYTLADTGLDVVVLMDEIVENEPKYTLTGFSVLPYFGAGGRKDEGYMVVPDGCGAVINFNNGKENYSEYKQYVYGRDNAIEISSVVSNTENALLPVYGISTPTGSMLAILKSGESRAVINSHITSVRNAFNTVYSEFIYRDSTMATFNDKSWNKKEVRVYEINPPQLKEYALSYYFLGQGSTYVDMASCYQRYLKSEKGIKPSNSVRTYPFFISTYGSVKATKHIFGFPVKAEIALTTYGDTQTILQQLNEAGVSDIILKYNSWINGGPEGAIPTNLGVSRKLGGKSDFKKLLTYMQQHSISSFFDVNLTNMYKSRIGYSKSIHSARMLNHKPAMEYQYSLSTLQPKTDAESSRLLNPVKVRSASAKVASKLKKLSVPGVSVDSLSHKLYSSFNEDGMDRVSSQHLWDESLEDLKKSTNYLLADKPNAYMLKYADAVTSLPTKSSWYAITDYDIPFYQIALHGLIPYSMEPNNQSSDHQLSILQALETGSSLHYAWIARNFDSIDHTQFYTLFSAEYTRWLDDAVKAYKSIAEIMSKISDQSIVKHEIITAKVRRTTYANGISVIVNYGETPIEVDNVSIDAKSYRVIGV